MMSGVSGNPIVRDRPLYSMTREMLVNADWLASRIRSSCGTWCIAHCCLCPTDISRADLRSVGIAAIRLRIPLCLECLLHGNGITALNFRPRKRNTWNAMAEANFQLRTGNRQSSRRDTNHLGDFVSAPSALNQILNLLYSFCSKPCQTLATLTWFPVQEFTHARLHCAGKSPAVSLPSENRYHSKLASRA